MKIERQILIDFINAHEGDALKSLTAQLYDASLVDCYGNASKASKKLGICRSTLWKYTHNWSKKNGK